MTVIGAKKIVYDFLNNAVHGEEEARLYVKALEFLIRETDDPACMMQLGGYYYEQKEFDRALKYYEMAEAKGHVPAAACLGYIWYYGRTGEKNYEKAFLYYSRRMRGT